MTGNNAPNLLIQSLLVCLGFFFIFALAAQAGNNLSQTKTQAIQAASRGDYENAIELWDKAIAIARQEYGDRGSFLSDLYFNKGVVAQESGKFQMSEDAYNSAIATNPSSVTARLQLANLLTIRDRADDGKVQVEKAVAINENSVVGRKALALCYQAEGSQFKAIQEFVNAKRLSQKASLIPRQAAKSARPSADTIPTAKKSGKKLTEPAAESIPKPAPKPTKILPVAKPITRPVFGIKTEPKPKTESLPEPKVKTPAEAKPAEKALSKSKKKAARLAKQAAAEQQQALPKKVKAKKQASESKAAKPKELKAKAMPLKIKTKGTPRGLVPPPPPVVPTFGGMAPPPPIAAPSAPSQPKPEAHAKPKDKGKPEIQEKSKPEAQEKAKTETQEHAASAKDEKSSHAAGADNSDFLLDWAGNGKKK